MRTIIIEVIPHKNQRYSTCGDWQLPNPDTLAITVSDTGNDRSNMLVAIHELVEALLCMSQGISPEMVDAQGISPEMVDDWDIHGLGSQMNEPGEHPGAPYHWQHRAADIVERIVCMQFGMSWLLHETLVEDLFKDESKAIPDERGLPPPFSGL